MNAPLYTKEILRLAASLPEPRTLEREDGQADMRSPTCGSRVQTSVEADADGRVAALSQQVRACAFGQAAAAIVQQSAVGRTRADAEHALTEITDWLAGSSHVPAWPGIDALAPARSRTGRHGAILLPFRTLAAALAEADGRGSLRRDNPPAP